MYFQMNTLYIEATVPQEASNLELVRIYQFTVDALPDESRQVFIELSGVNPGISTPLAIAACIRFNYARLNWSRKRQFLDLMDLALNHIDFSCHGKSKTLRQASTGEDLQVA